MTKDPLTHSESIPRPTESHFTVVLLFFPLLMTLCFFFFFTSLYDLVKFKNIMLRRVILAHTGMGTRAHTPRMRAHTKTTYSKPKVLIKIEKRNAAAEKIQMPS